MDDSPKGRDIEYVEGKPSTIIERGKQITELGDQMLESADVLEDIAKRAVEDGSQKGKAISKLRETIGDSYEKLRDAGELYQPVGPVITTYGEELEVVQPQIKSAVDECESLWATYQSLPGDVEPRGTGGLFQPDEGSPEAEQQAEEDAAKKAAYDAWREQAEAFDRHYDTWEDAFDDAVDGMTDGLSGSIKDSFWSSVADALGWVAFALAIVALVIGGPVLAAIALVAAAAYLFVVCMQYANDEASVTDIVLASFGIIPLGKISTFTKLAHMNKLASKSALFGKFTALNGLTKTPRLANKGGLIGIGRNLGKGGVFKKLLTGDERAFRGVYRTHKAFWPGAGNAAVRNGNSVRNLASIDFGSGVLGNLLGHYGNFSKTGLLPNLPSSWSPVTDRF